MIVTNFRPALVVMAAVCAVALSSIGSAAYAAGASGSTARTTATDHAAPADQSQSTSGTLPDISPATAPAPLVESTDVKPGDRWVFTITDDITGDLLRTLTSTVTENQGQTITAQNGYLEANAPAGSPPRQTTFIFDQSWNIVSDSVWTWKPGSPVTGLKLPLKLGAQWTSKMAVTRQAPALSYTQTSTSKVTSWDHIKLASGLEYDAYRVEVTTRARQNPQRLLEEKATFWYAPDANHSIWRIDEARLNGRLTSRVVQSLTDYKRRSDG